MDEGIRVQAFPNPSFIKLLTHQHESLHSVWELLNIVLRILFSSSLFHVGILRGEARSGASACFNLPVKELFQRNANNNDY